MTGPDARPALVVGGDEQTNQTAALDAFDRLRVREVEAKDKDTASKFLAKFQATAASLEPDERIELVVYMHKRSLALLKAVFFDPQASKVCSLVWGYNGKKDVNWVIPLLINNCPELASLWLDFKDRSAFDFASSVLEHPSSKLKVLVMPWYTKGDLPRFFAALGQSQVSALTLSDGDTHILELGLHEYLAKDLLVRFAVSTAGGEVPSELIMSLATCTRLAKLRMYQCKFSQATALTHLSKSITKLMLHDCRFADGFDWSFLAGSGVRELDLYLSEGGNELGTALAVLLRARGLDELRCLFASAHLAAFGVEISRIKRLYLPYAGVNHASVELIALALQSPNSEMKGLELPYNDGTMTSIETYLVPALRHPSCNLAKLTLLARPERKAAARRVEITFCKRLALFALLQGQQVRKVYCPLRRLPVEMFRMVGEVLM